MNQDQLYQHFEDECNRLIKLMTIKNGEYAGDRDALGNFKRGAEINGITALQVLNVYMTKHIDAVQTFIRDDAAGKIRPASEPIEGRFRDIVVYCIIAMALIKEATLANSNPVADRNGQ